MTRAALAAMAMLAALALAAQDRPPQIRSGVELVAVDVQVVDRAGNPVPNLTRDDFEVWIDGRKRSVGNTQFLSHGAGVHLARGPAGTPTSSAAPATGTDPGRPRRMFIIAVIPPSARPASASAMAACM